MRFLYNPITHQINAAPARDTIYSATAPVNPPFGTRWANTLDLREYLYVNGQWVEVGVGPAGRQGDKGDAATVAIGTTTTGAAGTNAEVTNSGTTSNAVFNFKVPKGDTGTAATVAVGTTTTGAAGTSAAVTNSGTTSAAVLNFTIPQGEKGDAGRDGTSVVLKGAVASFSVLPTTNRTAGDLWVTSDTGDGYVWSGTAWTNTGKIQGPQGPQATISVGQTVTGAAGTSALVENTGTPSAAVLKFTIPQGLQGVKGDKGDAGNQGPAGPAPSGTGAVVVNNGSLATPVAYGAANTANSLVQRDASGNFTAGTITANLTGNVTGTVSGNAESATKLATARTVNVSGDVTGTAQSFDGSANITIPTAISPGVIVDADISNSAAISDTKLATISAANKVSNSATTATNANTASAIVARDALGNFSAGTITANLTGNVTGTVTGNATNVTGTVAVANGGTGATTAAGALLNLGALASNDARIPSAWTSRTSAYTAVAGDRISTDTRVAAFTITLPASPANFTEIVFADHYNQWATRNLTIARNGQNIEGLAEDLVCNVAGLQITLRYEGTTWRVYT